MAAAVAFFAFSALLAAFFAVLIWPSAFAASLGVMG